MKQILLEGGRSAVYLSSLPEVYKKLPLIGQGMTSIVLDKGDGKVLMFTRDGVKRDWLTTDFGIAIGEQKDEIYNVKHKKMLLRDIPVYVIELPKLFKLDSKNKKLIQKELDNFEKVKSNVGYNHKMSIGDNQRRYASEYVEEYPDSILENFFRFFTNYDNAFVDLCLRNCMQDAEGKIVILDPVVSKDVFDIMKGLV